MRLYWRKISGGELPLGLIYSAISILVVTGARLAEDEVMFNGLFCPFKMVFGIPCPTCGVTRACAAVSHLNFAQAFGFNPLMVVSLVGVWIWGMADFYGVFSGGRAPRVEADKSAAGLLRVIAVAAIAFNWAYLIAAGV